MAQKPVPNALTLELLPVVAENLERHLDTEDLWFAHDYVPFEQGENFALLGGRDWDPSQATLPRVITDACEILLITKDNLAGTTASSSSTSSSKKNGVAGWAGGPPRSICTPSHCVNTSWSHAKSTQPLTSRSALNM
ncbi:putative acyl-[acyl-carrier-protein] desaturase desA2 [Mycobacterium xenopi 4042]|uniref:Putative acyl-[acyl-carrier-protein] desaturase desA2 n=1 Tax=Mycobacterium xenopi 4042 TaxID=1299334 RepID=X8APU2_MYCXE|nr:putative acyl-[acyl-carrier-protein] desaturase desA2 [Mycobacterium xenopi 4042]